MNPPSPYSPPPFATPRGFLMLAGVFLLLYVLMLAGAWRQAGHRAELETVISLPLPEPTPPAPAPAETSTDNAP